MTGGLCDVSAFGGNCLSDKAETKKLVLDFVDDSQDSMHLWYMCGVTCVNMQNLLFLFVHKFLLEACISLVRSSKFFLQLK